MDFWAETMQDDCYLIAADDWTDAARPTPITDDKSNKASKEKADLTVGRKKFRTELIPPALIIARYFSAEQDRISTLEADIASIQQQVEEMTEEHGADGGLLEEARNEKDKITRASAAAKLKDIKSDKDAAEERQLLTEFLRLCDQEAAASAKLKSAEDGLTDSVLSQYAKLTENDIKTLVVDDKWLASLASAIQGELDRVSQTLTGRIRQLADRYASPLPQLTTEVAALAAKVEQHLKKMGATWN
jgi:type I restriction enzyme M protein